MAAIPCLAIMRAYHNSDGAAELGASCTALLSAVCMQWDMLKSSQAVSWPIAIACHRSGLSSNTLKKARKTLADAGWLKVELGATKRTACKYTPCMPDSHTGFNQDIESTNRQPIVNETSTNRQNLTITSRFDDDKLVPYTPIPSPIPSPCPADAPANTPTTDLSQDDADMFTEADQQQAANAEPYELPERGAKDLVELYGTKIKIIKSDKEEKITRLNVCAGLIADHGFEAAEEYLRGIPGAQWWDKIIDGMAAEADKDEVTTDKDGNTVIPSHWTIADMRANGVI